MSKNSIMKKMIGLLVGMFFTCVGLYAQDQMVLDEHAQLRAINGSFDKIEVSHNIKLVLSQSNETALAVSATEERFIAEIKTEVENNVLKISKLGNKSWSEKNRQYTVYVSFNEIKMLKASGAAEIIVIGAVRAASLSIDLSGATEIRGTFRIDSLNLTMSGASEANLNGKVDVLNLQCSGASDLEGYNMIAENCKVDVSGASDVYITSNKSLVGNASGASNVFYKGASTVTDLKKSGASEIRRTGD